MSRQEQNISTEFGGSVSAPSIVLYGEDLAELKQTFQDDPEGLDRYGKVHDHGPLGKMPTPKVDYPVSGRTFDKLPARDMLIPHLGAKVIVANGLEL